MLSGIAGAFYEHSPTLAIDLRALLDAYEERGREVERLRARCPCGRDGCEGTHEKGLLEMNQRLRAEVERLRALDRANVAMLQGEVEEKARYKARMVQAEERLAKVVNAAKLFVTVSNQDRWKNDDWWRWAVSELTAALAAAKPEEPSRELQRMRAFGAAAQPEEKSRG